MRTKKPQKKFAYPQKSKNLCLIQSMCWHSRDSRSRGKINGVWSPRRPRGGWKVRKQLHTDTYLAAGSIFQILCRMIHPGIFPLSGPWFFVESHLSIQSMSTAGTRLAGRKSRKIRDWLLKWFFHSQGMIFEKIQIVWIDQTEIP